MPPEERLAGLRLVGLIVLNLPAALILLGLAFWQREPVFAGVAALLVSPIVDAVFCWRRAKLEQRKQCQSISR